MTGGGAGGAAATAPPGTGAADTAIDVARLRVAIARLSRRLRRHELAGLTPTQLSALATVERAGPLRLGDLAAAEGIAPSTLTRLVTALEERGYVDRCPVPGDARASTLAIAPAGRAILERIRQESTTVLADSLRTLTGEQVAALAAALPALEQLADAAPRGGPAAAGAPAHAGLRARGTTGGPHGPAQVAGPRGRAGQKTRAGRAGQKSRVDRVARALATRGSLGGKMSNRPIRCSRARSLSSPDVLRMTPSSRSKASSIRPLARSRSATLSCASTSSGPLAAARRAADPS